MVPDEYHKIQIFELDVDPVAGDGKSYSIGLAVVQMSNLIKTENASANMVGEFCKIRNEDLFYYGVNLAGNII